MPYLIKINDLVLKVGDREDSNVYIRMKLKNAAEVGISAQHIKLSRTTTHQQLLQEIEKLNSDDAVHGIILQVLFCIQNCLNLFCLYRSYYKLSVSPSEKCLFSGKKLND
jgi:hypothetical protein